MNRGVRPKHIDEYECSGPRPPVPGQESSLSKMTESAIERNLHRTQSLASYSQWNTLEGLLADVEGKKLFKKYVDSDAKREDSHRLHFYILCDGLKSTEVENQASCILAIYKKYVVTHTNATILYLMGYYFIAKQVHTQRPHSNIEHRHY